ncbi:hypothetical protein [Hydrogenophaga sp. 5NK40-0174]|uniref:hypothetical protein n=1 Tax=Hydrogenophaga sp. 5NK40-0174 TaxID=3127649 RepID=UPI0031064946
MLAYDLTIGNSPVNFDEDGIQGWCFGLPPGIMPEQWPLDRGNGYPLMHGFTLLLPPDYRVHGPDVVALSFFATPADFNDGGPAEIDEIVDMAESVDIPPERTDLLSLWHTMSEQARDDKLFFMEDILGCRYAVRLLSQDEFDGPLCLPPDWLGQNGEGHPLNASLAPPGWLREPGSLLSWKAINASLPWATVKGAPDPDQAWLEGMGDEPNAGLYLNRSLRWTPRQQDPNAGIAVNDAEGRYQEHYYWLNDVIDTENYRLHPWSEGHQPNHIGGTMRPVQAAPDFSPFYVEFEEDMGGYNFGGGNAQLDFKTMGFDWACG